MTVYIYQITNARYFPLIHKKTLALEQSANYAHGKVLERFDGHVCRVKVQLSPARVDVHVASADPERTSEARDHLPEEVEANDERRGEVGLEEGVGVGASVKGLVRRY